jgi:hypothetical protein
MSVWQPYGDPQTLWNEGVRPLHGVRVLGSHPQGAVLTSVHGYMGTIFVAKR